MKLIRPNLLVATSVLLCFQTIAQNTNYSTPFNSGNFIKTIDLSKPIGEINGGGSVTSSGGATYSIPIFTPPGTNGMEPSVSLNYNSQGGSGIAGFGWNISGVSAIGRSGKTMYHNGIVSPLKFTATDDAFFLDGVKLIPIFGNNGENGTVYAGEIETFSKIESVSPVSAVNPQSFKVTSRDGLVMEFGDTADSRFLTDDGLNILSWHINKIIDLTGNYIEFKYSSTDRHPRLIQILYTGNSSAGLVPYNQINFSYSIRSDQSVLYEAGAKMASKYILDKISVLHTNDASVSETVRTYKFIYAFDNITSLLKEIQEFGGDESKPSLNSTIFLYGDQVPNVSSSESYALSSSGTNDQHDFYPGDFNADGITDILAAKRVLNNNINTVRHTQIDLRYDFENGGAYMYIKDLPQGTSIENFKQAKFFNFLTADYDKDGRDDTVFKELDCTDKYYIMQPV